MGSTYLELTNRVIRKINEVELTESNFNSARGIQSLCKDSVLDAISEINQQRWEWPYHAATDTQVLVKGQTEYSFPDDFKVADWKSFQIQIDPLVGINNSDTLEEVDIDEWREAQVDIDTDNKVNGLSVPRRIFKTNSNGFGVTPIPDKEYTLTYSYFKNPVILVNPLDRTDIPVQFDNIIVFGALYHMNLFRENPQGYSIAETKFRDGIKNMYFQLVKTSPSGVFDTRINFGGPVYRSGGYHI